LGFALLYILYREMALDRPSQEPLKKFPEEHKESPFMKSQNTLILNSSRLLGILLLMSVSAVGQEGADNDEVFTLSAFEVAVDEDRGYFSPNSVVATGFSQEIFKTPLNLTALTEEFLRDVGSQSITDAIGYVAGVQQEEHLSQPQLRFRSRGFVTEYISRNGIRSYGGMGAENVDRIEFVKGPASVFFGQVSPGGVVNISTKRPSFTKSNDLTLQYGSYDHKYISFGSQGPLWEDSPLAYRIYASYLDKEDWRDFEFEERSFIYGGLQWQPSPKLKFFLEYEQTEADYMYAYSMPRGNKFWVKTIKEGIPVEMVEEAIQDPRYNPDVFTPEEFANLLYGSNFQAFADTYLSLFGVDVGSVVSDAVPEATPRGRKFNQSGPGGWRYFESEILTAEMNWNPIDWLNIRAIHIDTSTFRPAVLGAGTYTEILFADGSVRTAAPTQQMHMNESTHSALEAVLEWDAFSGSHRLLLGGSYYADEYSTQSFQSISPPPSWNGSVWNIAEQGYWNIREYLDFEAGFSPTGRGSNNFIRAYYSSYIGRFFDERLILMAGIREETFVRRQVTDFQYGGPNRDRASYEEQTPMAGVVYEFKEGFTAFASYSRGYLPGNESLVQANSSVTLTPEEEGLTGPNKEGEGIELGFKARTKDNRLTGTLSLFQIEFTNDIRTKDIERTLNDPRNPNGTENVVWFTIGGLQRVEGLEWDFIYTPIPELQLIMSYSWIWEAEVVENLAVPEQQGSRFANTPEYSGSLWAKYTFRETKLDGLGIGFGAKYSDWVWQKIQPDRSTITADAYVVCDMLVEYKTAIRGIDTRFALNVTNVFDTEYIASASGAQSAAVPGAVRKFMFTVDLGF
jgi:outer membrane receptor protein involved in Fe transport